MSNKGSNQENAKFTKTDNDKGKARRSVPNPYAASSKKGLLSTQVKSFVSKFGKKPADTPEFESGSASASPSGWYSRNVTELMVSKNHKSESPDRGLAAARAAARAMAHLRNSDVSMPSSTMTGDVSSAANAISTEPSLPKPFVNNPGHFTCSAPDRLEGWDKYLEENDLQHLDGTRDDADDDDGTSRGTQVEDSSDKDSSSDYEKDSSSESEREDEAHLSPTHKRWRKEARKLNKWRAKHPMADVEVTDDSISSFLEEEPDEEDAETPVVPGKKQEFRSLTRHPRNSFYHDPVDRKPAAVSSVASRPSVARSPVEDAPDSPEVKIMTREQYSSHKEKAKARKIVKKRRAVKHCNPYAKRFKSPHVRAKPHSTIRGYQESPSFPGIRKYIGVAPNTAEKNNRLSACYSEVKNILADRSGDPKVDGEVVTKTKEAYSGMLDHMEAEVLKEQRVKKTALCNYEYQRVFGIDYRGSAIQDHNFSPAEFDAAHHWTYQGCALPKKGARFNPEHLVLAGQRDLLETCLPYPYPEEEEQKLLGWFGAFKQETTFDDFLERCRFHFTKAFGHGDKEDWTTIKEESDYELSDGWENDRND